MTHPPPLRVHIPTPLRVYTPITHLHSHPHTTTHHTHTPTPLHVPTHTITLYYMPHHITHIHTSTRRKLPVQKDESDKSKVNQLKEEQARLTRAEEMIDQKQNIVQKSG